MKLLAVSLMFAVWLLPGCDRTSTETTAKNTVSSSLGDVTTDVQFFNEAVLGKRGTETSVLLLPASQGAWSPSQVILDFDDTLCYGAMVHYSRSHSFEDLRSAINARFKKWEHHFFASDPTMGIWRNEDDGFTIQLSDCEEEDTFVAVYIRFVEAEIVNRKMGEALEKHPEFFEQMFREDENSDAENENGR